MLEIVASYHCMQFEEKPMIQTQENDKKPHSGPNLGQLNQIWTAIFFFFFFKNMASLFTRYQGQLSSYAMSEKTNGPILRKFSDGRIDRQDGRK